jgi:hypothetical protein
MSTVVTPLLKAATWVEQASEHGLLIAPLNAQVAPAQAPVVAYVIDQGDTVEFLPASETNAQQQDAIHQAALASLRQRLSRIDWEPMADSSRIMMLAGDFNAAECLLLPERLQEAHALLNAPDLLACTPKRGVLLVGAYDPNDKYRLEAFVELCYQIYYGEEDESVSPVVWGISEGRIKDALQLEVPYLRYLQERYGSDAAAPPIVLAELNKPAGRVFYSPGQIAFMTLFGTLLAGMYALASNYKHLGMTNAMRFTWLAALILLPLNVFWFMGAPSSPYDKLYPLLPAFFLGVGGHLLQGWRIKQAMEIDGRLHGVWRQCLVVGISLLTMVPLVAVLISFTPE